MPSLTFRGLIAAVAALVLCPACASTSAVHGRQLASAGAAYGKAADLLLQATQAVAVDADSARLLSEGQGLSREECRKRLVAELEVRVDPRLARELRAALDELVGLAQP